MGKDPAAAQQAMEAVYSQLHYLARLALLNRAPGQALQPTLLVHELYLRLAASDPIPWESRRHFYNYAARAMRRICQDFWARENAIKRGGGAPHLPVHDLQENLVPAAGEWIDWGLLEKGVQHLEQHHPDEYAMVELHYFCGLSIQASADLLGISVRTAGARWRMARVQLQQYLKSLS
jgi:RNA polymerase sigma factor (TIGR02999 family)